MNEKENHITGDEIDSFAIPSPPDGQMIGTTLDTGMRLCPLCQSEIKLFFINFNEKMVMCENTECEFPFGYEDLQFVKEDNGFEANEEVDSIKCFKLESAAPTGSVLSSAAWYEIDQINAALQAESTSLDMAVDPTSVATERLKLKQTEKKIREQLEDIKSMALELQTQVSEDTNTQIKNQKWLRNLKSLQEMSGVQLLKPEEVGLLKKEEPELGLGELKIDINPGDGNTMSSIRIEIHDNHFDNINGGELVCGKVNAT